MVETELLLETDELGFAGELELDGLPDPGELLELAEEPEPPELEETDDPPWSEEELEPDGPEPLDVAELLSELAETELLGTPELLGHKDSLESELDGRSELDEGIWLDDDMASLPRQAPVLGVHDVQPRSRTEA